MSWPGATHLDAHREHPPAARVRQAGRIEPGFARRRGTSLDRVMSSPLAASTIDPDDHLRPAHDFRYGGVSMNEHPNAVIVRSAYEAFANGDGAALAALLDDGIIWHESTPGFEGDYHGRNQALGLLDRVVQEVEGSRCPPFTTSWPATTTSWCSTNGRRRATAAP